MPRSYATGQEPIPGYRLSRFLGRGGFGEVWKARAPGGTECALKIINLKDRQGIKEFRAIRLVKCISHPHLTPIYALWLKDQQGHMLDESSGDDDSLHLRGQDVELIIAMQLGSRNLLDRLEECQREGMTGIPVADLLDHMEDAAKGIDYLNQPTSEERKSGRPSIQHCDIKPQNILLVGNSAQVCDFGLARPLNDARKTSQAAISFAYVSPELIQDQTSPAVDQYSLAISYYELRTGSLPFAGSSAADVMFSHLQGKLTFAKVSEGEQAILKRGTALKPEERFPSCLEMIKALRRTIEGRPSSGSGTRSSHSFRLLEMAQPGDEIVPGYRLVRKLGRGGYGEVWEATAPGGKRVALKIIQNLDRGGARHEFRALEMIKGLDHNHLMEVHAYWLLDAEAEVIPDEARDQPAAPRPRTLVIASKLASKNLLQVLQECQEPPLRSPGIPFEELVLYMRQAAEAIDYLNSPVHPLADKFVSIQHRDIKPENILLAAKTVKLSDFGLAKVLEGSSAVIHGDSAGLTFHYAAPEVFHGEITARSDQYSLALTYLHLRTGLLPFASNTRAEIMRLHVEGRIDLSRVSEQERNVLAKATALNPRDRYQSCMEMVDALEATAVHIRETPLPSTKIVGAPPKTHPVIMEKELSGELARAGTDSALPGELRAVDADSALPAVPVAEKSTPTEGLRHMGVGTDPELPPVTEVKSVTPAKELPPLPKDPVWVDLEESPAAPSVKDNIYDTVGLARQPVKTGPLRASQSSEPPLPVGLARPPVETAPAAPVSSKETEKPLTSSGDTDPPRDMAAPDVSMQQFTVYQPRLVQPQKWYTLLAFAHLSERPPGVPPDAIDPIQEVLRQAREVLGEQTREYHEVTQDSRQAVPREGEITFLPEVAGVEFNPPRRCLAWKESVNREEFLFCAAPELEGRTAQGRLSVFLGSILLADIPLSFRVDSGQRAADASAPMKKVAARPYRKIFASYSHKDLDIVRQFENFARAVGDQYLRDSTHLRAGEVWNERLKRLIDGADVFQLFWSSNSMRSPYVQQEWKYALSLGRPNFIRPTYWEDPLPTVPEKELPPESLLRLHFQQIILPPGGQRPTASGQQVAAIQKTAPTAAVDQETVDKVVSAKAWQQKSGTSTQTSRQSKRVVGVVIVVILAIAAGVGVTYVVKHPELFGKKPELVTPEPPKPKPEPNQKNPPIVPNQDLSDLRNKLQASSDLLGKNNAEQAHKSFDEALTLALKPPGFEKERMEAILGLTRSAARLGTWPEVLRLLAELDKKTSQAAALTPEQQTIKLALEVFATDGDTRAKLERLLALYQPENRIPSLVGWERDQVVKTIIQAPDLDKSLKAEPGLDKASALAKLVLAFDSENAVAKEHAIELAAIDKAREAKDSQSTEEAAKKLGALLKNLKARKRPVDLAKAYADLSLQRDNKHRPSDLKLLIDALAQVPKEEHDQLRPKLDGLIKGVTLGIRDQIALLNDPRDFATFEPTCANLANSGSTNPYVWCCWAECLLEKTRRPSPALLQQAQEAAWNKSLTGDVGSYGHYVRGRLRELQEKLPDAVDEFGKAFGQVSENWENPSRRLKAADAYFRAGTAMKSAAPPNWTGAFDLYFKAVNRLHPDPDKDYRLALAEAAIEKMPADKNIAKQESSKLLKDYSDDALDALGPDAYTALSIHARSLEGRGGEESALRDYDVIVNLAQRKRFPDIKAEKLYERVIQPAISVADSWLAASPDDRTRKKQLARMYSYEGHLLWENLFSVFQPVRLGDRAQKAVGAYAKALEHYPDKDGTRAEMLMWYGFLLTRAQSGSDQGTLRKLADEALTVARDFHGSQFLDGLANYYEAYANVYSEAALSIEKKSIDALERAIAAESQNPPPELLDVYYSYHSGINVLKANSLYALYGVKRREEYQKCLEDALKDADYVIRKLSPMYEWLPYLQRGNAEEDLAWLCGQERQYAEALKDFRIAIDKSRGLPQPHTSRGRAFFKRYETGSKQPVGDLNDAKNELEKACTVAEQAHDDGQLTEAALWLGRTCLALGKNVEGTDQASATKKREVYQEAIDRIRLAIDKAPPWSLSFATNKAVNEELLEAYRLAAVKEDPTPLTKAVREHCANIRKKNPSDPSTFARAVRLASESWLLEGNQKRDSDPKQAKGFYQEALQLCDDQLNAPNVKDLKRCEVLLVRADMLFHNADLRNDDLSKETPSCLQNVQDAIQLADESGQKSPRARARYRLALCHEAILNKDKDVTHLIQGIDAIKKALEIDPDNAESWKWRLAAGNECLLVLNVDEKSSFLTADQKKNLKADGREFFKSVSGDDRARNIDRQNAANGLEQISKK